MAAKAPEDKSKSGRIAKPKPSAILLDFVGTIVQSSFAEKHLVPEFKRTFEAYLQTNWDNPKCQEDVKALTAAAAADSEAPKIEATEKKDAIEQIAKYVEFCESKPGKLSKPLLSFRFHVWFDLYDRDKFETPVHPDAERLRKWKSEGIKLFMVSNGWSEATKKFLSKTKGSDGKSMGDLSAVFDDFFDPSMGSLTDAATFKKIATKIKVSPEKVLFLTKSVSEAKAACGAGLDTCFVITHTSDLDACKDAKDGKGEPIPIARILTHLEWKENSKDAAPKTPKEVAKEDAAPKTPKEKSKGGAKNAKTPK